MRRNIEDIEIKEPPLQELNNKRSCVKRSCITGCGCILVFVLVSALIVYIAANPRKKELKVVPANFPVELPVYDKDAIHTITFISGQERSRWMEIAAYVPKVVVSPLIVALDRTAVPGTSEEGIWDKFIQVITEPVSDHRDQIEIEWNDLSAQPKFIKAFYQNALKKEGYTVIDRDTDSVPLHFLFSKMTIDGMFTLTDDPKKDGTDYAKLTIRVPAL